MVVWLLYSLFPCSEWFDDRHGATVDCDCQEYLDGVFSTPDEAKKFIPQNIDENINVDCLEWAPSFMNPEYLVADSGRDNLWFTLRSHGVDGCLTDGDRAQVENSFRLLASPYN